MKIMNWEAVEETTPFQSLPAGGYVVTITDVKDDPSKEYLTVLYDVKEGEHRGFFNSDFGRQNAWAHQFIRSYKESAQGMFKAFLKRLEESNPGFTVAQWQVYSNERQLIGLELGVVVQTELYTNNKGEDKDQLKVVGVYASQDIRNGDYKVPEVKDSRTQAPSSSAAATSNAVAANPYAAQQAPAYATPTQQAQALTAPLPAQPAYAQPAQAGNGIIPF